jgi:hypothetical protein
MTIVDSFDPHTEAIINPSYVQAKMDDFPKVAVVCFGERVIEALRAHGQPKQIDSIIACVTIPIYQIRFAGTDIAVYCSTLGGPASAVLLEEMIAKGCEKFVFFGSCGVLNREIAAKSLLVPTAAYRDEGTSYHYMPPGEYVDIASAGRLAKILPNSGSLMFAEKRGRRTRYSGKRAATWNAGNTPAASPWKWNARPLWPWPPFAMWMFINFCMRPTTWTPPRGTPGRSALCRRNPERNFCASRWKWRSGHERLRPSHNRSRRAHPAAPAKNA